jgi:preprotein translocase subunit SecA
MLQVIDNQWKDHLLSMDELKQGIGNRAYGQKDPLVEYKKGSYELFTSMMDRIGFHPQHPAQEGARDGAVTVRRRRRLTRRHSRRHRPEDRP